MESFKVIAVILAVFLHHGNGRDESASKGSDGVILPMEGNPVWRHKRSLPSERQCRYGHATVRIKDGTLKAYPVCKTVAISACGSAIPIYGKRKCKEANFVVVSLYNGGTRTYPTKCTCAA